MAQMFGYTTAENPTWYPLAGDIKAPDGVPLLVSREGTAIIVAKINPLVISYGFYGDNTAEENFTEYSFTRDELNGETETTEKGTEDENTRLFFARNATITLEREFEDYVDTGAEGTIAPIIADAIAFTQEASEKVRTKMPNYKLVDASQLKSAFDYRGITSRENSPERISYQNYYNLTIESRATFYAYPNPYNTLIETEAYTKLQANVHHDSPCWFAFPGTAADCLFQLDVKIICSCTCKDEFGNFKEIDITPTIRAFTIGEEWTADIPTGNAVEIGDPIALPTMKLAAMSQAAYTLKHRLAYRVPKSRLICFAIEPNPPGENTFEWMFDNVTEKLNGEVVDASGSYFTHQRCDVTKAGITINFLVYLDIIPADIGNDYKPPEQ